MFETSKVRIFFQGRVEKYDSIYGKDKKLIWRVLDFIFRRSIQKRFELTLKECVNLENKKILDIGCGPGIYLVTLAKRNPGKIVGLDFSEEMLNQAKKLAKANRVSDTCQFINADFRRYIFNEKFDICLAIGLFDYIENPQAVLEKIRDLCLDKAIISFPAKWRLRNIVRIIRLKSLRCPVYFYTARQIHDLLNKSGFKSFDIKTIDRDYFVVAKSN